MGKLILILGGARSGKSRYAVELAKKSGKKVAFIATATPKDEEMTRRIKLHRISRPKYWKTIEESRNIILQLSQLRAKFEVVLVDCLGLLISNFLSDGLNDREIEKRIKSLTRAIAKFQSIAILVSNEVGMGIVPDNPLARRFRDLVGLANQIITKRADEVIFMQAGIPLRIKGGLKDAEIR